MLYVVVVALAIVGARSTPIDSDLVVVRNILRKSYVQELHDSIIMRPTIDSIVAGCDRYTFAATDNKARVLGDYFGLFSRDQGIDVNEDSVGLYVSRVLYGTPSHAAGICIGDRIMTINDVSVLGKTWIYAMNLIIKADTDKIKMGLVRNGKELEIDILRGTYLNSAVTSMVDNHIGYVRIARFTQATSMAIDRIFRAFKIDRIRRVVIDLRSNGGGLLEPAVELLRQFAAEGDTLYSLRYKSDSVELFTASRQGLIYGKPLEVLVGENTASSSEVFALGVKSNDYGYILGDTTFGKGRMQHAIVLPSGQWFQYTQAIIKGPKNTCIDREYGAGGIVPDLPFRMGVFHFDTMAVVASYLPDMATLRSKYPTPDTVLIQSLRTRLPAHLKDLSMYYIIRVIWNDLGQLYWISVQPRYARWKGSPQLAKQQ